MAISTVALLPNVKESFSSYLDEYLSDSAFNQKYGNDILALYKFDDLDNVRLANSKAGIKPIAPLSAFDKENSIEFPLDSVHYLYKQSNPNPVLLSRASL